MRTHHQRKLRKTEKNPQTENHKNTLESRLHHAVFIAFSAYSTIVPTLFATDQFIGLDPAFLQAAWRTMDAILPKLNYHQLYYYTMAATAQHASKFQRFLNSETGPRTVHFWAPVFKWSLVIAGLNDIQRPVEKILGTQQLALFCTGAIWTRWAGFVIRPKNFLLASVNFFLGGVAGYQLLRIVNYRRNLGDSPSQVFNYIWAGENTGEAAAALES